MGITELFLPTHVYFGKGAEELIGEVLKNFNARKVLIHYGSGSVKKTGLLDKVKNLIKNEGISFVELGGVVPNPRVRLVNEGVRLGKKEGVDFVLALGGGSVIDSAKAICYGLYDEKTEDVWDYYAGKKPVAGSVPLGVILTLSATGSEMSDSSVITNDDGMLKRGINSNLSRPKFALLNPELTYSVSPYQTSCGTVDIMMHTMERYFHYGYSLDITDELSLALIKETMKMGKLALSDPTSYQARSNLMWAGTLSHNGLMQLGNEVRGDWASHQLEHELSGMYDVAHGAGLSAIWPSWARYVYEENPARFASFGRSLFNIPKEVSDESAALEAIDKMEAYFKSINMPVTISELGFHPSDEDLHELAHKASFFGKRTLGSFKTLEEEDMYNIYKNAL